MNWGSFAIDRSLVACVLAFACVVAFVYGFVRRARYESGGSRVATVALLALRIAFALLVATLYLDPRVIRMEDQFPRVAVVIDDSVSMTRESQGTSARGIALAIIDELRTLVERRAGRVELLTLSSRPFDAAPSSYSAIRDVVAPGFYGEDSPGYARVFLLSDGVDNRRDRIVESERVSRAPTVDALALGGTDCPLDWRITRADADYSPETGRATVSASVELIGATSERVAKLRLWTRRAANSPPRLLREERASVALANPRVEIEWTIELDARDADNEFVLHVADASDVAFAGDEWLARPYETLRSELEFALVNNFAALRMARSDEEKVKILLVDDEPSYEFRYMRELLRREDSVELRAMLLAAEEDESERSFSREAFARGEFQRFDLIILGATRELLTNDALARLLTTDDYAPSVWLLNVDLLLSAPDAFCVGQERSLDVITDSTWRLAPNSSTRRVFPELNALWLQDAALERVAPTRIARVREWRNDVEPLLLARRSADGETPPVLLARQLSDRKIACQTIDELWRLQTLDDKALYRLLILRVVEYLTERASCESAPSDAAFDFIARSRESDLLARRREEESTRATLETLTELTAQVGGATLDLRDLDRAAALSRASEFLLERLDALEPIEVETSRSLMPRSLGFAGAIACVMAVVALEVWRKRRHCDA